MRARHDDPSVGETRIKRGFLFFPKYINHETRWLELATWIETYEWVGVFDQMGADVRTLDWSPTRWVD